MVAAERTEDVAAKDRAAPQGVSEIVSYCAAGTSLGVIGIALLQLFAPQIATPFTGLEPGAAASVLAIQWAALGVILAMGGLIRLRMPLLFAADFLLICGLSGSAVMMLGQPEMLPLAVHGAIALVGLLNGGLARLARAGDLAGEA